LLAIRKEIVRRSGFSRKEIVPTFGLRAENDGIAIPFDQDLGPLEAELHRQTHGLASAVHEELRGCGHRIGLLVEIYIVNLYHHSHVGNVGPRICGSLSVGSERREASSAVELTPAVVAAIAVGVLRWLARSGRIERTLSARCLPGRGAIFTARILV
jgi:hypothetical protein